MKGNLLETKLKITIFTTNINIETMKKLLLTISLLNISIVLQAQSTRTIESNNAYAMIANSGILFNNKATSTPGYKVPKTNNPALIYSSSFWFAGKDENDNLGLAGLVYGSSGNDFRPGPYTTTGIYSGMPYGTKYSTSIWKISLPEINDHITYWNEPGYVVPENILKWPGNGDTNLGVAHYLAPFVDLNDNGIYEPELGEYPSLKECESVVYMILNDDRPHTETGGTRLGIEIHFIFYQYSTNGFLNDVTFVDVVVYNRSSKTWDDFKIGMFMDPDMGNYADDHVGSHPDKNLFFVYNGDNNDETGSGTFGHGTNPPSFGVISLNQDLTSFISYGNTAPKSTPTYPIEYWNNLNGLYSDASQILDNNGNPTKLMYTGNPSVSNSYSQYQMGEMAEDRRVLASYDMDNFAPGTSKKLSLAIIYYRNGNHLQNVTGLFSVADQLQNLYDNQIVGCNTELPAGLGISTLENTQPLVYPNPATDNVIIQLENQEEGTVSIYSINGSEVLNTPIQGIQTVINTAHLNQGVYFINVQTKNKLYERMKLIITE